MLVGNFVFACFWNDCIVYMGSNFWVGLKEK